MSVNYKIQYFAPLHQNIDMENISYIIKNPIWSELPKKRQNPHQFLYVTLHKQSIHQIESRTNLNNLDFNIKQVINNANHDEYDFDDDEHD